MTTLAVDAVIRRRIIRPPRSARSVSGRSRPRDADTTLAALPRWVFLLALSMGGLIAPVTKPLSARRRPQSAASPRR
jgi:hypothetical protein